ncbi:MAG: hypothetical protein A3C06_01135 [Candidatus Taylorbacteria bacterium RIFCSPHIGHO2_02_FULL_46_13]|uniref:ATP synthase F1 complex delta/epsilon subunit N-terminal domain-containing protein n=1 Tax=Candidatus Taylorbacteria bacterium RIFCSPHIGHO2_02_FULL_46_13 TaxID=1802312 RepID=A0A1G2MTA5_9BACT|nr:MAG: hypothetical protein A3C06_01135 [Candidatus Taylorbacteria bacterium RIFCSPHIGHO2_02_FULL_46_13]
MHLYIYSLDKTLFEGETNSVILPSQDGEIGVLPHHEPLVTALRKGVVAVGDGEEKKNFEIEGGFAYTDGARLIVLAD